MSACRKPCFRASRPGRGALFLLPRRFPGENYSFSCRYTSLKLSMTAFSTGESLSSRG